MCCFFIFQQVSALWSNKLCKTTLGEGHVNACLAILCLKPLPGRRGSGPARKPVETIIIDDSDGNDEKERKNNTEAAEYVTGDAPTKKQRSSLADEEAKESANIGQESGRKRGRRGHHKKDAGHTVCACLDRKKGSFGKGVFSKMVIF